MKEIKKILDFIFYFSYGKENKQEFGTPLFLGTINVSLIFGLIFFILVALLEIVTQKDIMVQISDIEIFVLATFNLFISHLMYGYKKKYLEILEELSTYRDQEIKKYKTKTLIFIGILLMILVILLITKKNM